MNALVAIDAFRAQLAELEGDLPGPADTRRAAFAAFEEQGIPTRRDEDWRFTSLASFAEQTFAAAEPGADGEALIAQATDLVGEAWRVSLVNGHVASVPDGLPSGVAIGSLAEVLREEPERVAGLLGAIADEKQRAFTALNRALFADGVLVEIAEGVSLERPIHLVHALRAPEGPLAAHPRHLIDVGPGSRAVIVEHTVGAPGEVGFANPVTEIRVGRDARIDHVVLQEQGRDGYQLSATEVHQEAGSRFSSHSIALGGRLARLDLRCALAGEGAHVELLGLYLARGAQLLDHHTTIDHATPHTSSDELYKGILDDRAVAVFHGRIQVRPHAQKIAAMQQNRNLLLSDRAAIHTKPQLEINANDVRCSHGATIGQLDQNQLFYLQTRGVGTDEARALLMLAFASEVLERLPVPALRERLEQLTLDWLPRRHA